MPRRAFRTALLISLLCAGLVLLFSVNDRHEQQRPQIGAGTDFLALYLAVSALERGGSPYDISLQYALTRELFAGRYAPDAAAAFTYPPWLPYLFQPLARLPYEQAGAVWFVVNLSLLGMALALWLTIPLRDATNRPTAYAAAAVGVLYPPTLGLMVVGQYSMPVIAAVALLSWGLERRSLTAMSIAAVLATFKPHLGIPIAAMVLAWTAGREDPPRRVRIVLPSLVLLSLTVFLVTYAPYRAALQAYLRHPAQLQCVACSPLSMHRPWLLALVLLVLALAIWWWHGRAYERPPAEVTSVAILLVLLGSPVVRLYDFALAALPLSYLWWSTPRRYARVLALSALLAASVIIIDGRLGALTLYLGLAFTLASFLLLPPTTPHARAHAA